MEVARRKEGEEAIHPLQVLIEQVLDKTSHVTKGRDMTTCIGGADVVIPWVGMLWHVCTKCHFVIFLQS